jgi:cation diffusion facilitator CzcD-associated flavoprotein CzcO
VSHGTHCVIGAGFAGLAAARALVARGVDVEVHEARPDVGGLWLDGVYDSTHLITSRKATGFPEFPMPADWPDFPSRALLPGYFRAYAEHFDLVRRIRFGHTVRSVAAAGPADGTQGWDVTVVDDTGATVTRRYAGVVIANGHHWDPVLPTVSGHFTGQSLHSHDYRRPEDLAGPRVLVVGAGNSACDLVVEAAERFGWAAVSMRRTRHLVPKTVRGVPITELSNPWLPTWVQRSVSRRWLNTINGPYARYGLPEPDHPLYSGPTTINTSMLSALRHGTVSYRPGIARADGNRVLFSDGREEEYDTIVWATGYRVSFPFLAEGVLDCEGEVPRRVAGVAVPGRAGLYVFGLIQLRGGAGPQLSGSAELLADLVGEQAVLDRPVADVLAPVLRPDARFFLSVPEMVRQTYRERKVVAAHRRLRELRGQTTPVGPRIDVEMEVAV